MGFITMNIKTRMTETTQSEKTAPLKSGHYMTSHYRNTQTVVMKPKT